MAALDQVAPQVGLLQKVDRNDSCIRVGKDVLQHPGSRSAFMRANFECLARGSFQVCQMPFENLDIRAEPVVFEVITHACRPFRLSCRSYFIDCFRESVPAAPASPGPLCGYSVCFTP